MKIKELKNIQEKLGFTHLVVFGIDKKGKFHVGSHGKSASNSYEAAEAANNLKKMLDFPSHLCNTLPLQRICGNCYYYESYYGIADMEDWDRYDITGCCNLIPNKMNTNFENYCAAFDPKPYI